MELITGGAYQGKLTYAKRKYRLNDEEIWDLAKGVPERAYRCYTHLEAVTGETPDIDSRLPLDENSVVISRETGCGVVPMDAGERLRRERHGAVMKRLAERADRVTRIFCGLEERLK